MQLTWPDELKTYLEKEAEKAGYSSVDEYTLQIFLKANPSDRDLDSMAEFENWSAADLDREILAGINSGPAMPMTADNWEGLRTRVMRRLGGSAP